MFAVIMIPIQALAFILIPLPQTVVEYFDLLRRSPLLGPLDLDLLRPIDRLTRERF